MPAHVRDFVILLQTFFRPELLIEHVLAVIHVLPTLWPLLQLHSNQHRMARQRAETGWLQTAKEALQRAFMQGDDDLTAEEDRCLNHLSENLQNIYDLLDLDEENSSTFIPPVRPPILVTHRQHCFFCKNEDGEERALQKRFHSQTVHYIDANHVVHKTLLAVGHCRSCSADYYPNRFTFRNPTNRHIRLSQLEFESEYLRISKNGVWVHRKVARVQEKAVFRMRVGWSNYADYLNDSHGPRFITTRQSRRMFLEHMGRRLLLAHELDNFRCRANTSPDEFCQSLVEAIGRNGGHVPGAHEHGCEDCAHEKRYLADLLEEGIQFGSPHRVADGEDDNENVSKFVGTPVTYLTMLKQQPLIFPPDAEEEQDIPNPPPRQEPPGDDEERGYVRCCVMDGKTIGHRVSLLIF